MISLNNKRSRGDKRFVIEVIPGNVQGYKSNYAMREAGDGVVRSKKAADGLH